MSYDDDSIGKSTPDDQETSIQQYIERLHPLYFVVGQLKVLLDQRHRQIDDGDVERLKENPCGAMMSIRFSGLS